MLNTHRIRRNWVKLVVITACMVLLVLATTGAMGDPTGGGLPPPLQ